MVKFKIGFLLIVLTAVTISCKQNNEKQAVQEEVKVNENHSSNEDLRLDNGKKWQANIETTQGVIAMQELINEFKDSENKNYSQLKTLLENEFAIIFEKCTMKGESHEQLHKYLYPLKQYFSDLEKDSETAASALLALEAHIPNYFDFFE